MQTALTPEILTSHGFVELEQKDIIDRPIYRLSDIQTPYGDYGFNIEIVLSPDYKQSNPNCGVVTLHLPEYTYQVIPDDLIYKSEWTEEDEKRADESVAIMPEARQPIAWHVTTYERLRSIVLSLTQTDLEYGK